MNATFEIALISAGSAVVGAFVGSIAPAIVALLNSRAETRRERLRIATQLALAEHDHMMMHAQKVATRTGRTVSVPPMSATFLYHLQLLDLAKNSLEIQPDALATLRRHNKHLIDAISGEPDPRDQADTQ